MQLLHVTEDIDANITKKAIPGAQINGITFNKDATKALIDGNR